MRSEIRGSASPDSSPTLQPPSWEPSERLRLHLSTTVSSTIKYRCFHLAGVTRLQGYYWLMMMLMIANIYGTYGVLGSKHLGLFSDPRDTPLRQALLLPPFYRWENLEGIVAEQVWGRNRAPGPGREMGVVGWGWDERREPARGPWASSLRLSFGQLELPLEFHCLGTNSCQSCGMPSCSLSPWTWIPAPSIPSAGLLVRLLDLSEPQFLHPWNGYGKSDLSIQDSMRCWI